MRIAYVVPGGLDRSGTHRVIPHLVERLTLLAERHDLHVVCLRQEPGPGEWLLGGFRVQNIGARPRGLRALRALLDEHRRRPFDAVHSVFLQPQGVVAGCFSRLTGVPHVGEAPGGDFTSLPDIGFGGLHRPQGRASIHLAARLVDVLLVPSEAAARTASEAGFPPHEVLVWGVDRRSWPSRQPRRRNPSAPLDIVWIGSLNRVKDPGLALEIAKRLHGRGVDYSLTMIGEAVDFDVEAEARALELGANVVSTGFLPQAELMPRVASADVLLLTSRFEGGPRVVLEAATQGVPCVGTHVGLLQTLAPHAARTSPVGDSMGLADHLSELATDEDARTSLGEAAHAWARTHDAAGCVCSLERIYGSVASPNADSAARGTRR